MFLRHLSYVDLKLFCTSSFFDRPPAYALNEHTFHWIGTKFQLADPMTKEGGPTKFKAIWNNYMIDMENYIGN